MLSHRIITYKPKVYAPPALVGKRQPFATQEDLDTYLEHLPYNEGDFVTLSRLPITFINQVHCITRIERDVNKLEYSAHTGAPHPMFVLSCALINQPAPWVRWDNPTGYRMLSENEFKTIIVPIRDQLQDHCTKWG